MEEIDGVAQRETLGRGEVDPGRRGLDPPHVLGAELLSIEVGLGSDHARSDEGGRVEANAQVLC